MILQANSCNYQYYHLALDTDTPNFCIKGSDKSIFCHFLSPSASGRIWTHQSYHFVVCSTTVLLPLTNVWSTEVEVYGPINVLEAKKKSCYKYMKKIFTIQGISA